jgi:hypothetical protein
MRQGRSSSSGSSSSSSNAGSKSLFVPTRKMVPTARQRPPHWLRKPGSNGNSSGKYNCSSSSESLRAYKTPRLKLVKTAGAFPTTKDAGLAAEIEDQMAKHMKVDNRAFTSKNVNWATAARKLEHAGKEKIRTYVSNNFRSGRDMVAEAATAIQRQKENAAQTKKQEKAQPPSPAPSPSPTPSPPSSQQLSPFTPAKRCDTSFCGVVSSDPLVPGHVGLTACGCDLHVCNRCSTKANTRNRPNSNRPLVYKFNSEFSVNLKNQINTRSCTSCLQEEAGTNQNNKHKREIVAPLHSYYADAIGTTMARVQLDKTERGLDEGANRAACIRQVAKATRQLMAFARSAKKPVMISVSAHASTESWQQKLGSMSSPLCSSTAEYESLIGLSDAVFGNNNRNAKSLAEINEVTRFVRILSPTNPPESCAVVQTAEKGLEKWLLYFEQELNRGGVFTTITKPGGLSVCISAMCMSTVRLTLFIVRKRKRSQNHRRQEDRNRKVFELASNKARQVHFPCSFGESPT